MAERTVIRMGHPTLRLVAEDIRKDELNSADFKQLLQDLYDTMKKEGGIGIAAPQINVSKKVALIQIPEQSDRYGSLVPTDLMTIINPQITVLDESLQGFWEGCLSVPGLRGFVERPRKIQIDFLNRDGKKDQIIAEGFLATVFQHELDHLFGKLYIDSIKDLSQLTYIDEYLQFHQSDKK